jgi:hypothetical protein
VVQKYSYKIYFIIFGHSYKFLRILEFCTIFWELNQLKNDLKSLHSAGLNPACGYSARLGSLPRVPTSLRALRCGHRVRWHARRRPGGG